VAHWFVLPVQAYNHTVEYEDGSVIHLRLCARAFLLFDLETGNATHLINGAGDPCLPGHAYATPCAMGWDPAHHAVPP
jgi:hypothetical protein